MGGFFVILFIAFAIIMVAVGASQSKRSAEAWAATARTLGLSYNAGGTFGKRTISGRYRDNHVIVDTFRRGSGKNSSTYTRYRIRYPRSLGLGLRLTQEGFFTGVSKAFGAQDIEVGDAVFDQAVLIKGNNPQAVARFLTLARRSRIHRAMLSFKRLKISDDEVYWEHTGVCRDQARLSDAIRRLSLLAWFLCGERTEDQALEKAAQARQDGHLDEAIKAAREVPAVDNVPPIEARVMEAHMLHLGNRGEEAGQLLDEVSKHAPDDEEVKQWTTLRQQTPAPPPLPGAEPPAPPSLPTPAVPPVIPPPAEPEPAVEQPPTPAPTSPEPATPEPALAEATMPAPAPPPSGLGLEAVCAELFGDGSTSAHIEQTFAASYAGQRVTWQGTLSDCRATSFDFVFGNHPCTKATVELIELDSGAFGRKTVKAIVQFPPESEQALKEMTGQEITFSGELLKVDGLMRNLFVRNASLD